MYAVIIASLALAASAQLAARQVNQEEQYITSVCSPANVTNPVPPCIEIVAIEGACTPPGTAPIDYLAHQECMCTSSYFSDWTGCLNCQYVHGARSQAEVEANEAIITRASQLLCTGTPTAFFSDIFASVSNTAVQTATGAATVFSDQFPSMSAVSLYFTASGSQGPGTVTGSATAAFASGATSASTGVGVAGSLASSITASGATATASTKSTSAASTTSAASSGSSGASSATSAAANSASASAKSGAERLDMMAGSVLAMGLAAAGLLVL